MRRAILATIAILLLGIGKVDARPQGPRGGVGSHLHGYSKRVSDIKAEQFFAFFLFIGGVFLVAIVALILRDDATHLELTSRLPILIDDHGGFGYERASEDAMRPLAGPPEG